MKLFKVNKYDWWAAETAEQARNAAIGYYDSDDEDEVFPLNEIEQVSETDMERLKLNDEKTGYTRTFKQEIAKRIKEGANKPHFFASTEY